MPDSLPEISARDITPEHFQQDIVQNCRPVVLRGLVADWPVVDAARSSPRALKDYLAALDSGRRIDTYFGDPAIGGKYYYTPDLQGFNFERKSITLREAMDAIVEAAEHPGGRSVYAGAAPTADFLPGFADRNPLPVPCPVAPRIWLGTASNVSSHYDTFDNVACVIAGQRRFTLYAPELIAKLYVGPIDNTMAGAPVSLAASAPEGSAKDYPLFEEIRDQALKAELEPGDALYIPKLWWHQVESLAPINGLANYWWDTSNAGPDLPYASLLLAMITIAERPVSERQAWRAFFDHFVFRTNGHPLAHLPASQHGVLGPLKDNYGKIRARVMHMLRAGR